MSALWDQFVDVFANGLETLAGAFSTLGDHRWAAAIIVLTLIVKTLLIPLTVKQVRSQQAMQRIQPEVQRLQKKYAKDRERLAREQQELWKREGVNPLGCMFPMLAQMPIFFAVYHAIRNLSSRQDVEMPFLGLGELTDMTSQNLLGAGGLLLTLMILTQVISTKQLSTTTDPRQQRLFMIMPVFFGFIMMQFPVGLVLYWTTQNIYQFVQQKLMLGRFTKPEEISTKAIEKGASAGVNGNRAGTTKNDRKKKNQNVKRRSR
ncbi:MAG TPA: YidC/Oxa1 family membrane protein insertase [Actinomycetota bacterium]|nr:YidC/Oxa1 family membrane protein insertase [Actinomycetota bacterium]